jgi:hypothetical protein
VSAPVLYIHRHNRTQSKAEERFHFKKSKKIITKQYSILPQVTFADFPIAQSQGKKIKYKRIESIDLLRGLSDDHYSPRSWQVNKLSN